ncbi:hypothetical protein B4135_1793 [Caldibacillus debilis]|uniref:Uncharacterized protein n=1 Tax=Caldibacillus debilis TaxID=301148 RepID=A0A150M7Y6_9BACI|nr:hypothetical protein B4135_1793 [Caldibacillus debilis]
MKSNELLKAVCFRLKICALGANRSEARTENEQDGLPEGGKGGGDKI